MIALLSFLFVVLFSIIVVRIGTVALRMTGLSRDVASFQAQSAFSGVGFTTSESEYVVSHPVRRRIIRILMLLGSAGLTSAMATLVLTFVGNTPQQMVMNGIWLVVGLGVLAFIGKSKLVDRGMSWVIEKALERVPGLRIYDYEQLLGLGKGYSIAKLVVKAGSWLEGKKLREVRLSEEGVLVLAIYRKVKDKEVFIGAPRGDTELRAGDILVCYGHEEVLQDLRTRIKGPLGDLRHEQAVEAAVAREFKEEMSVVEAEEASRERAEAVA